MKTRHQTLQLLSFTLVVTAAAFGTWAVVGQTTPAEMATFERGYLGFEIYPKGGAFTVVAVDDKGPAARAGILPGDQVLAVDGRTVSHVRDLESASAEATIAIKRGAEIFPATVTKQTLAEIRARVGLRTLDSQTIGYDHSPLGVGEALGHWTLLTIDGETVELGDEEWLTLVLWSPECSFGTDEVLRLAQAAGDGVKHRKVLGLIWGRDPAAVRGFLAEHNVSIPQVYLPRHGELAVRLGIYTPEGSTVYPQTYDFVDGLLAREPSNRPFDTLSFAGDADRITG